MKKAIIFGLIFLLCVVGVTAIDVDTGTKFQDNNYEYTVITSFTATTLLIEDTEFYINGNNFCDSGFRNNFNTARSCPGTGGGTNLEPNITEEVIPPLAMFPSDEADVEVGSFLEEVKNFFVDNAHIKINGQALNFNRLLSFVLIMTVVFYMAGLFLPIPKLFGRFATLKTIGIVLIALIVLTIAGVEIPILTSWLFG